MASLALCSNNKLHFTIVGSVTGAMPGSKFQPAFSGLTVNRLLAAQVAFYLSDKYKNVLLV